MDTTCNRVDMAVKASCKGGFYSGGFGYYIFKPLFYTKPLRCASSIKSTSERALSFNKRRVL